VLDHDLIDQAFLKGARVLVVQDGSEPVALAPDRAQAAVQGGLPLGDASTGTLKSATPGQPCD